VFAVGLRRAPGERKTGTASHWKIMCAVEPREILVLEEWRVKLAGEKG
jgi:hypothetical protein